MSTTERGLAQGTGITSGETDIPASGTPAQIIPSITKCLFVIICNVNAADAIYIGDSAIDKTSARAIQLKAGENIRIDINDPSLLYADGTTNGNDVGWAVFT